MIATHYLECLEKELQDILNLLGLTELAMLFVYRGWNTIDKIAVIGQRRGMVLEDFNWSIRQQYRLLLKDISTTEVLLEEFWVLVCHTWNERNHMEVHLRAEVDQPSQSTSEEESFS